MEFAAAALTTVAEGAGLASPTALAGTTAAGAAIPVTTGSTLFAGTPFALPLGAAGGAGAIGASLGKTSTWAGLLSGGATVASMMNTMRAGELDARRVEALASDAETEVKIEEVKGLERRNTLKAALVNAIGERDVATAASGVDLSFGTPAQARKQAQTDTEVALSNDQATEDLRKSRLRERAANYRIAAAYSRSGALGRAAGIGLSGAADIIRRG